MISTPERRRYSRYRTDLPINVRDETEHDHQGRCNIIAEGGLGATLAQKLPVGSVVRAQLALPTHPDTVELWAVVRYCQGQQHGLEFFSLTEPMRLSLMQFCNQLAIVAAS